jgi:predicted AAA+ superfamily ATPase
MKFVQLKYIHILKDAIKADNGLIQVLIGPRQVGKTTSLLRMIEDHFSENSRYTSADKIFRAQPCDRIVTL